MTLLIKRNRFPVLLAAALMMGLASGTGLGIGGYTFIYARGLSYLTDAPETCANCHVMQEYFDGWAKSSHKNVAVCNDCHTPHNIVGKYYVKAMNGFHHSLAFTTGHFPDVIQIKPGNRAVTEESCRYCHESLVQSIDRFGHGPQALECLTCHHAVGHMN